MTHADCAINADTFGLGQPCITKSIAEGHSTMAVIAEDPERRQTVLKILADLEQTIPMKKADTEAQIARTWPGFTEEKVWSAEDLLAVLGSQSVEP